MLLSRGKCTGEKKGMEKNDGKGMGGTSEDGAGKFVSAFPLQSVKRCVLWFLVELPCNPP